MHIAMLGTRAVGDHRQRRRPQLLNHTVNSLTIYYTA